MVLAGWLANWLPLLAVGAEQALMTTQQHQAGVAFSYLSRPKQDATPSLSQHVRT
jgi:hypothetical protein